MDVTNDDGTLGSLGSKGSVPASRKKKERQISFLKESESVPSAHQVTPRNGLESTRNRSKKDANTTSILTQDKRPEWYEELSESQINMFKELFEMLDKDGGGSINHEDMFALMKELDIDVSLEEIRNVLVDLDKDGNGEIDFDEFLYCMAETSYYLDSLNDPSKEEQRSHAGLYNKRQTLFFTAITRFAIKNSLGEIERYYANKVRHAPHVISCYTAGVRLIGLNDHQLEQEIRRMQRATRNHKSPYAKPLPFVTPKPQKTKVSGSSKRRENAYREKSKRVSQDPGNKATHRRSQPAKPFSDDPLPDDFGKNYVAPACDRRSAITNDEIELMKTLHELAEKGNIVAKIPDIHLVPQIRTKLASGDVHEPICSSVRKRRRMGVSTQTQQKNSVGNSSRKQERPKSNGPKGWVIPLIERGQVPLPVIKLTKGNVDKLFTIEDVPDIRKWVSEALDVYYSTLRKAYVKTAFQHWNELHTEQIKSKRLRELFRKVYVAYAPRKEEEIFVISPWSPQPWYFRRTSHKSHSLCTQENRIGSFYSNSKQSGNYQTTTAFHRSKARSAPCCFNSPSKSATTPLSRTSTPVPSPSKP